MYLLWAGSELRECRQRLQTYRICHCSCTAISRALGTEQTCKQNKHPLPQATPCLQSTRQRRELQSNLCTITQQHQAWLGFWSTTSLWVTVSWHASLFLVHRFLWSSGQSQPFGPITWDLQADLSWEAEKFVFADTPWPNKARWDQTSAGLTAEDYSKILSYRNKKINKCLKQLYAAKFVNIGYYWILHQVT